MGFRFDICDPGHRSKSLVAENEVVTINDQGERNVHTAGMNTRSIQIGYYLEWEGRCSMNLSQHHQSRYRGANGVRLQVVSFQLI